ncbi:hypothetical protein [Clostridium intestinale]|uniref:Uncharacterized protein n=1 Tax=Clostridium intestinale DSM 6191 TaxID=1121320 RepID=A0A1M5ZDQ2_9CLOT|nr:hypothetical protein [Clostridium intestinale]SHI22326.1 hypothetical protein SAMN02745941_02835 [Clostridium intestinale DSM 6191]
MSAFVLNRNYELQLPSSFVDVDREEMEYVDGGITNLEQLADLLRVTPSTSYWWGRAWDLSGDIRTKIGNKFGDVSRDISVGTLLVASAATALAGLGLYFNVLGGLTSYALGNIGAKLRDATGGATLSFNASAFHVNPW